ncbi:RNA-guided endonuclease IscB [Dongshaea marina]|uniref:RNA-guided endonuclease IscB n=1 Tax=Dongshaea marina TaxID=2047966 RepID=UPI000D3E710D|nr:RNA-guided endonuclease IscB [Dongshaea marina]
MQRVLVLSSKKQPLMPCHPARARELLKEKKAAVFRRFPFTIILKEREGGELQRTELKLDPGSKTTGMALTVHGDNGIRLVWAGNLSHRGHAISESLSSRAAQRRARRNRKTRYRPARFDNRAKPKGWLAPSLMSRVHNCETWAYRLIRLCPVTDIAIETVRFDMQLMANPKIAGVEYQQGSLHGYELREYLLQRDGHTCRYCGGASGDPVLNIDHVQPRAKGGSDSAKNLVTSCRTCNEDKGATLLSDWLKAVSKSRSKLNKARATRIPKVIAGRSPSMRDAAAVNATRYRIGDVMKATGLPTTFWSGGRTKFNRSQQGYQKDHWLDAACVGETGQQVFIPSSAVPLAIKATGHGSRQMTLPDKYGFPRTKAKGCSRVKGFRTGDVVKAVVPVGKYAGKYLGRISVRKTGTFSLQDSAGKRDVSHRYCTKVHSCDGYSYA